MANTTNFNWETPDDTDLVKDGALAIRTLGSAIDTSLVDLKGGTTDQVLAKNSNTDMDFKWVTSDDANAIQNAIVDAKGDLIAASAADTPVRLAAGTNEHRLVADSAQTAGLKYVADTTNYAIAAKGDLLAGTAADTLAALTVGTNGHILTADSAETTGLKWVAPTSGSTYVGASAYKSAAQSINSATYTLVTFDVENFDTDSIHDNSSNTSRMTIPTGKGGKYLVTGQLLFASNSTGIRICEILKNGSNVTYIQFQPASTDATSLLINWVVNCVATDYIEVRAYQDRGSALNLNSGNGGTSLQVSYLGA